MRALRATCLVLFVGSGCGDKTPPRPSAADAAATDSSVPADAAPPGPDSGAMPDGSPAATPDAGVAPGDGAAGAEGDIDRALLEGRIDVKTAAYYHLLAGTYPGLLPEPYAAQASPMERPSLAHKLTASMFLEQYTPAERQAVQALIASPDQDEFMIVLDDPGALRAAVTVGRACDQNFVASWLPGQRVARVTTRPGWETTYFKFHIYLPTGASAADEAALAARVDTSLGTPVAGSGAITRRADLKEYVDAVYEYYRDTAGMGAPAGPMVASTIQRHGGKIPVFIGDCDGWQKADTRPDGAILLGVDHGLEDPVTRQVILPHEIFHVFELGRMSSAVAYGQAKLDERLWPMEAAATAMEDFLSPSVRRWSGITTDSILPAWPAAMNRIFRCPSEPFHTNWRGPCKLGPQLGGADPYQGDYSKFVYFKFLLGKERDSVPANTRARRMGAYWDAYVRDLDPKPTVTPTTMHEFFESLVADRTGARPPDYEPADRTAFTGTISAMQGPMDPAAEDPKRYTVMVSAGDLSASQGSRLLPGDLASDGVLLDRTSEPLAPKASHRWLVKVPDFDAAAVWPRLYVVAQGLEDTNSSLTLVGVGEARPGVPAREADFEAATAIKVQLTGAPSYLRWADQTSPYALAIVTNHSEAPLAYKLAIMSPNRCKSDCPRAWADWWRMKMCPEISCEAQIGNEGHMMCLAELRDQARLELMSQVWCDMLCLGYTAPHLPYPPEFDDNGSRLVTHLVDSTGLPRTTPSGFFPLRMWPMSRYACGDWLCDEMTNPGCNR